MDKDEQTELFEEGEALEKALEFPPISLTKWPGKPPWDEEKTTERRKNAGDVLGIYEKNLNIEFEEYGAPPQVTVDKKYRMREWVDECVVWLEGESSDDRKLRLDHKFEELFGRDQRTLTMARKELPPGRCCEGGVIYVQKIQFPSKGREVTTLDGYITWCRECEEGQERYAAWNQKKKSKKR